MRPSGAQGAARRVVLAFTASVAAATSEVQVPVSPGDRCDARCETILTWAVDGRSREQGAVRMIATSLSHSDFGFAGKYKEISANSTGPWLSTQHRICAFLRYSTHARHSCRTARVLSFSLPLSLYCHPQTQCMTAHTIWIKCNVAWPKDDATLLCLCVPQQSAFHLISLCLCARQISTNNGSASSA